ncbi:MAG TPA: hypothetical protein VJ991_05640 [Balneolales bacterium]|nr:hypothetical protein [Balneolales bacterium]
MAFCYMDTTWEVEPIGLDGLHATLFRSGVHLPLPYGVIQGLWPLLNGHHLGGGAHWIGELR